MPEGHTVHRLARDMAELQGHHVRALSPQGRFTAGAEAVDGTVLRRTEAYGKHLFLHTREAGSVHVHLGMQGKWFRSPDPSTPPLRQVRLRLAMNEVAWDLVAPSTCELLSPADVEALMASLGPDPLRPDADEQRALASLATARIAIGAALLDQRMLSGVGNVFRNEALHAVGIAPGRPAQELTSEDLTLLWNALRRMMRQAVEDGRIVTVEGADRLEVPESEARKVYKQQRCRDCGAPVVISQVGGRTAYHCPVEQVS